MSCSANLMWHEWGTAAIIRSPGTPGFKCGGVPCESRRITSRPSAFEVTRKRRKGFPSESRVKRGYRVVGGTKDLVEKLGRNDPCPCGSGRRFQALLHAARRNGRLRPGLLLSGSNSSVLSNNALERTVSGLSERAAGAQRDFTPAARGFGLARPAQRGR
jgi:hypothetical protein